MSFPPTFLVLVAGMDLALVHRLLLLTAGQLLLLQFEAASVLGTGKKYVRENVHGYNRLLRQLPKDSVPAGRTVLHFRIVQRRLQDHEVLGRR